MNIMVEENFLHLRGGRKIKKENRYSESKFDNRMTLGDDVEIDAISASLGDGVLELTAAKTDVKKPATRVISIASTPTPKKLGVAALPKRRKRKYRYNKWDHRTTFHFHDQHTMHNSFIY
jgi:hypothetical protein